MSDFDEKDIHEDVTAKYAGGGDFDPADIHENVSSPKDQISKLESFGKGVEQGGTLGFADELQGLWGTELDSGHSLLHKLGLTGPSPSQVNADLYKQGFKGQLGPTDATETYQDARDSSRKDFDAAQSANPMSSLAGNIIGGVATLPALPESLLGQGAAKGAPLLAKVAAGAKSAAPLGAIAGLGAGKSDLTEGDVEGATKDAFEGGVTGAAVGGALPVLGAGLKSTGKGIVKTADALTPEIVKDAFKKGKEGVDVASKDFYDSTVKRLQDLVDMVSNPMVQKSQAQKQAAIEEISALEGKLSEVKAGDTATKEMNSSVNDYEVEKQTQERAQKIAELNDKIKEMRDTANKTLVLGQKKASAQNARDVVKLNQDTLDAAQKLQEQVADVKTALGKKYDILDAAAEKTGIVPENREALENFATKITNQSGLPKEEIDSLLKKVASSVGEGDIQSYRNVKKSLSEMFENNNPVVKRAAKEAYANVKNDYSNALRAGGYSDLADSIADTNKKWTASIDLEDKFLSNLKPNRVDGKIIPSEDTVRAVSNYADKNPIQMVKTNEMDQLLKTLNPEIGQDGSQSAPGIIRDMNGLAQDQIAAKNFNPKVSTGLDATIPKLPDPRIPQAQAQLKALKLQPKPQMFGPEAPANPEIARLQNLLQAAKGKVNDSGQVAGLPSFNPENPQALKDQLGGILPKSGMNTGNAKAEGQLSQVSDYLKQNNPELADKVQKMLPDLNKDIRLSNSVNGDKSADIPTGIAGAVNKLVGGTVKGANKAGMAMKAGENFLQRGVKTLSDATPEQITQLVAGLKSKGPSGAQYGQVLEQAQGKNSQSRNAIIFGLMQQPSFRALFHDVNGTNDENGQ